MWLYHGTYDMFYLKIIKDGVILARSKNKDSSTDIIDRVINTIAGKIVRGNNVYLTNETEALDGFDRYISNRKHYDCTRLNEFLYYDNIYLRRKRLG